MQRPLPSFRVMGPADCARTQALILSLVFRGLPVLRRDGPSPRLAIRQPQGPMFLTDGGPATLELLEELLPERGLYPADACDRSRARAAAAHGWRGLGALERVTAARNLRDLDIAVFALRDAVAQIERLLAETSAAAAPGNPDVVLLPLFWRIALLDLRHAAHLGDGFTACARRVAWLLGQPPIARHFRPQDAHRYLDLVGKAAGILVDDPQREDWDQSFTGNRNDHPGQNILVLPTRRKSIPAGLRADAG